VKYHNSYLSVDREDSAGCLHVEDRSKLHGTKELETTVILEKERPCCLIFGIKDSILIAIPKDHH
jgi:hypothetical protein